MIEVRGCYHFPDGPRGIGTGVSLLTVVYSASYDNTNRPQERIWWREPITTEDATGAKVCARSGYWVPQRFLREVGGQFYAPPYAPKFGPKED
jgi:hypothetical protein